MSMCRASMLAAILCATACSSSSEPPPVLDDDAGMAPDSGAACPGAEALCGDACCAAGEQCTAEGCCPAAGVCGAACCAEGEVCEDGACHPNWSGCAGECAAGDVCYEGACITPGAACDATAETFCFVQCPDGEYCDVALGRCLPRDPAASCVAEGEEAGCVFDVVVELVGGTTASTPAVADLDGDAIPEIVYGTGGMPVGSLVALHGDDGSSYFSAPIANVTSLFEQSPAVGNLDADPQPEIVICSGGTLAAFEHDGTPKWGPSASCNYASAPAIADLDQDGAAEVLVGYHVVNGEDGSEQWLLRSDCDARRPPCAPAVWGDPGDFPIAADVSGDGRLDVVFGNVAWSGADGTMLFETTDVKNGAAAVADLDLDGDPEIVSAYFGTHEFWPDNPLAEVNALHHDGTRMWGPVQPDVCVAERLAGIGAGAPTVADLDRDGAPEVIVVCEAGIAALRGSDGAVLWTRFDEVGLGSASATVFDFEGDGSVEIVYRSRTLVRILRGRDGALRYSIPNESTTSGFSAPIVADVDGDGHAEIAVGATEGVLRVFGDRHDSWAATRPIWNQHSYHVTNVEDDLAIPRMEPAHWRVPGNNTFRQNAPGALRTRGVADLIVRDLSADAAMCPTAIVLFARVANQGAMGVPAGQSVAFYRATPAGPELLGTGTTSRPLVPGDSEAVRLVWTAPSAILEMPSEVWAAADDEGTGRSAVRECNETNNEATTRITVQCGVI